MADLTPNDIVNKQFRLTFRGYAQDQVDDFLQHVSDSLFRVLEENQRLRAQNDDLRTHLQQYQQTEELVKNALVLAQRTADEVRQHAHEEADLIRREAEDRLRAERAALEDLRQQRHRTIAELRAMLEAQLSMVRAQNDQPLTTPTVRTPGEDG